MEVVSAGQEKDSAGGARERSGIVKCAEEAQLQASADLLSNLRRMVNEPSFSDVVFVCNDEKRVQANRMLLAGRSEVLKSMFMNGMAESSLSKIELPAISSAVLLSVFEFLFTGALVDYPLRSFAMACELIIASRFFLLPHLEKITRKFMHAEISAVAQDLPTAACLLTNAVGYKALCDETDVNLQELVIILNSNWSDSVYVRSLSEDAFHYLLANSKGKWENDDRLSFKEYLRFRQVIRWWVYQSGLGSHATEELVDFLAPDEKEALSLCKNPGNFKRPESPTEDEVHLIDDWSRFQAHEASRKSAIRLLAHIDCRWIHPALLMKVVAPLEVISPVGIQNSYLFHALRRPMVFKTLTYEWEHGEPYSTLEQGFVIQRTGNRIGNSLAVMKAAMSRTYGIYQWSFILEKDSDSFVEMGFLYYASGVEKPALDGETLSDQHRARVLKMWGHDATVNWEGAGERVDWKVLVRSLNRLNMKAIFTFDALEHTCSLAINNLYSGIVWKNLPSEVFYPAVSFGSSSGGCVSIELISGFDII